MLSSRPQHALYADKENAVSAAPSRKAGGLSAAGQVNMLKTPGAKHQQQTMQVRGAAKTVKATSSKQSLESTQLKDRKLGGAATIALEPGARVLGAKDGNNRALQGGKGGIQNGKGKGKAMDTIYDDCSLMPVKNATTVKKSTQEGLKSSKKATAIVPSNQATNIATAKTPARQTAKSRDTREAQDIAAAYKTPRIQAPHTLKRTSPANSSIIPSFSAFKTPSPNQLLRRRKGVGSPVPLHFNPTSLRLDGSDDQLDSKPPKPTLLEELEAYHATIDETQEVDSATRQAVNEDDLPVDLPFEMPNYKEMDILGITFQATFPLTGPAVMDETTPISYDDSDMHARDHLYDLEWDNEPLFPINKAKAGKQEANPLHKLQATKASTLSGVLASKSKPTSNVSSSTRCMKPTPLHSTRRTNEPSTTRTSSIAKVGIARPQLTSKSSALRVQSSTFRLSRSDLPEVVDFDLGDLDLLL